MIQAILGSFIQGLDRLSARQRRECASHSQTDNACNVISIHATQIREIDLNFQLMLDGEVTPPAGLFIIRV